MVLVLKLALCVPVRIDVQLVTDGPLHIDLYLLAEVRLAAALGKRIVGEQIRLGVAESSVDVDGPVDAQPDDVGTEDAEERILRDRDLDVGHLTEELPEPFVLLRGKLVRLRKVLPVLAYRLLHVHAQVLLQAQVEWNPGVVVTNGTAEVIDVAGGIQHYLGSDLQRIREEQGGCLVLHQINHRQIPTDVQKLLESR